MNIIKSINWKKYIPLALAIALVAALYSLYGCPIRRLTGIPCPGCGTTHAVYSILRGDFHYAWILNPIAFTLPIYGGLYLFRKKLSPTIKKFLVASFVFLILAIYIIRMLDPNCLMVKPRIERGLIYQAIESLQAIFSRTR